MFKHVQAPNSYSKDSPEQKSIFLAGSIEMGVAENWQEKVIQAFSDKDVLLLNPRRDDFDASQEQTLDNEYFFNQVDWEHSALEYADVIMMYFDPNTKSPISLLELGLFAHSKGLEPSKLIVCCPEGFWRKGNVDYICKKYALASCETLDQLIARAQYQIFTK